MRHIGLFGGSFNPIHTGHTSLADKILKATDLDEIWFVISPQNPLKQQNELMSEQSRLQMVDIALRNFPDMHSCDIEFHLPKPSYTINTLTCLKEKYPDDKFSLVIGSDNLRKFHLWREHETILRDYPVIVYPRQGDDIEELQKEYPMVMFVDAPLFPISSTEIRNMLQNKDFKSVKQWLDKEVLDYLKNKMT